MSLILLQNLGTWPGTQRYKRCASNKKIAFGDITMNFGQTGGLGQLGGIGSLLGGGGRVGGANSLQQLLRSMSGGHGGGGCCGGGCCGGSCHGGGGCASCGHGSANRGGGLLNGLGRGY